LKKSYKNTIFDTFKNGIAQIILVPLVLLTLPLLTKNLSVEEYGLWGLVFTTCSLTMPLTSLGLGTAMSRFISSAKNKKSISDGFVSVLLVRLILSLFIAVIIFLYSNKISNAFFGGNSEIVKITSLFVLITTLEPLYNRFLRIIRHVKTLSVLKIVDGYGALLIYILVFYLGGGLFQLILAALLFKVSILIFLIYYLRNRISYVFPDFSILIKFLKYGLPTLPSSMSFWIVNLSDRYFISFFLGTAAVGIYSASYSLGNIPRMFSALINFIIMIAISKLYDEGKYDEVKDHLSYALKYFLMLAIPYVFGSLFMSNSIIKLLTTNEIAEGSSYVTFIVSFAHLILGIYSVFTYVLLVTKKTKILTFTWIISLPLNLILNYIFIPYVGIIGAACTTLVAYLIAMVYIIYYSNKEFKFNIDWNFIFKSIFSSIMMSIFILYNNPKFNIEIILILILSIVIYFTSLFILKAFNESEINFVKNFYKNKKQ
jgi:O-antigen/teichoic acid export membrane protein